MIEISALTDYHKVERKIERQIGFIYFLFHGKAIIYIGKAVDAQNRIESHRGDKEFDSAKYAIVPYSEMEKIETACIKKYRPILNQKDVPKGSVMFIFVGDKFYQRGYSHPYKHKDGLIYGYHGGVIGYYNDSRIAFNGFPHIAINYDRDTMEFEKFRIDGNSKYSGCDTFFDKETFKFIPVKREPKPQVTDAHLIEIPANYRFKTGKYQGELLNDVLKKNEGYVNWFINHPLVEKWLKQ